jgi:hypothetical protein
MDPRGGSCEGKMPTGRFTSIGPLVAVASDSACMACGFRPDRCSPAPDLYALCGGFRPATHVRRFQLQVYAYFRIPVRTRQALARWFRHIGPRVLEFGLGQRPDNRRRRPSQVVDLACYLTSGPAYVVEREHQLLPHRGHRMESVRGRNFTTGYSHCQVLVEMMCRQAGRGAPDVLDLNLDRFGNLRHDETPRRFVRHAALCSRSTTARHGSQ